MALNFDATQEQGGTPSGTVKDGVAPSYTPGTKPLMTFPTNMAAFIGRQKPTGSAADIAADVAYLAAIQAICDATA